MADLISHVIIFVVAFAYVLASIFIGNKWGGRKRLKQIQARVQAYQKEFAQATKANDEAKMKNLQLREQEIMGYTTEMLWLPWKSAVFILPVFFLIIGTGGFLGIHFAGILPPNFPEFLTVLPFEIHYGPLFSGVSINPLSWPGFLFNLVKPGTYGAKGFFIACVLIAGMIAEAVVSKFEKKLE